MIQNHIKVKSLKRIYEKKVPKSGITMVKNQRLIYKIDVIHDIND